MSSFGPQGHPEQGVHVFTDWSNLLIGEIKGGIFGGNALPGVRVFEGLEGANNSAIDHTTCPIFFGLVRHAPSRWNHRNTTLTAGGPRKPSAFKAKGVRSFDLKTIQDRSETDKGATRV